VAVSVIIPTLNEESCIAQAVRQIRAQRPHEVIVVDGGSSDSTRARAALADLVVVGERSRSKQMNLGAARATGDVLLFLHADCTLEAGAVAEAEQLVRRRGVAGGCFRMQVAAPGLLFRSIGACATARTRLTGIVYGDQGLFVRRDQFERLGGFPPLRLMEDLGFSACLRRHGRVVVAGRHIFVSPRRWLRMGLIQQTLRNWTLTLLAIGGVHPDRLARFYPATR
jgi:rSAM/selenodomain-associated transferase 2